MEKTGDAKLRPQLLSYIFFKRSQKAAAEGELDEARQLAAKVDQLDQRAYLLFEIAAKSLDERRDRARAEESLAEVVSLAAKADNTSQKARTLLGAAQAYAKFDLVSASEVMGAAVKAVNSQTGEDFSRPFFIRRIIGENFSHNAIYQVEGFSLENVFRTFGAQDFTGALLLAEKLEDKSLRAAAIIGLASKCLEDSASAKRRARKSKSAD